VSSHRTSAAATSVARQLPSVDVLIPVRNRARFIALCLDSVRAQTLQPNSVIVVDDGSTDDTARILDEYAEQWPKLRLIRSVPRGVSHARNLGLAAAAAPFVAFLDSDDIWWPEKLERQLSLFRPENPRLGFVHCAHIQIDECGRPLFDARIFSPSRRGDVFKAMIEELYHIAGSASAVVARRELIQQAGGFDETLLCGEDQDLWQRLARISHVDYVPAPLVGLRLHSENGCNLAVMRNPELVLFQRLKIWNKWMEQMTDSTTVLEAFRREAVSVGVANVLKRNPDFGLYGRLKRSDLALARRLYSGPFDYARIALRLSMARDRIKYLVATRVIPRSRVLLRFCQMFGMFKSAS
jgi:glycosyltransferase involved in cell wall biosynthesis